MNIKPLNKIDIVISVFNQENLIEKVLYGLFKNTTTPFNLIIVFDGCTDKTEKRAFKYIKRFKPKILINLIETEAPNVYETKANNIGFKLAKEDYMLTLQDDMVINELGWERRLTYPLRKFNDILAVSARHSQDIDSINGENHNYINRMAKELGTLPRNIFAIRDVINRGPVAFRMDYLREMNYLNEDYAPSDLDDADLCLRAWEQKKWKCGAFWIDYISKIEWGKTRSKDSTMYITNPISKNGIKISHDHFSYLASKIKHTENIKIESNEIDYTKFNLKEKIRYKFIIFNYPVKFNRLYLRKTIISYKLKFKKSLKKIIDEIKNKDTKLTQKI